MSLNYEDKMRMLKWVTPTEKDKLLARLIKGETIDLHKDEDLFYQINIDRLPMEKVMNRDKYKPLAQHMKDTRTVLHTVEGKTIGGHFRYKGEIPADIYFTHPWFSPTLSKEERDANIEKFFRMFPDFSTKGR
jgi:hypothetical protein